MHARRHTLGDGTVATIESFAAGPEAPLVHFAHATGMCAALYRPLLDRLAGHVNVVASDARGHGATTLPADPARLRDWDGYAADLGTLLDALPPAPRVVLAGHSMGATVSMLLAARRVPSVAAVVMIEPAFVPLDAAAAWAATPLANPLAQQAARRRGSWPSRDAMRAAYRGRGVFARWADADLDAYLAGGVRDCDDGTVELACAPAWEAATFSAVSAGMAAALATFRGPLALLHGTTGITVTADDAATIALRPETTVRHFADGDHFVPLAETAAMADAILALAR